jgi:signal transduction histidine kinase
LEPLLAEACIQAYPTLLSAAGQLGMSAAAPASGRTEPCTLPAIGPLAANFRVPIATVSAAVSEDGASRSTDGPRVERADDLASLGTADRCAADRRQGAADRRQGAADRRQVRKRPKPADRTPTEHARELAHDLSEGIGTISLFTGSLELHLGRDLEPAAARDLAGIRAGLERMSALIAATLEPGAGSALATGHRPVDTNVVLADARANLEARIARAGARIVSEPLPWVLGDATELTRLFQNLLANAVEHRDSERAPKVRVGARPQGAGWLFEVLDNGRGIEPGVAARAFDPARRGPEGGEGRGLGLGICARIVAAHGGRIWATARPEGGTAVSFELPRARRTAIPEPSG